MSHQFVSIFKSIVLIAGLSFFTMQGRAQFTISESFKGNTVANGIILGGSGSGRTNAYLTSGNSYGSKDEIGDGWLRLTEAEKTRSGYAYIDESFPSNMGVYVEFEYKAWRDKWDSMNSWGSWDGADGFSVFLFDAATPTFRIGGWGGSLGYANYQYNNTSPYYPGLAGGYIGLGIDEFGNYVTKEDGRNGGLGKGNQKPNSIVLRGSEQSGWAYLNHIQLGQGRWQADNLSQSVDYDHNPPPTTRPSDNTFYRRVKMTIDPIGTSVSPKYKITLYWTTDKNSNDYIKLFEQETTEKLPNRLKIGFAASTGDGFNYHEIRNLFVTTPGDVLVQKSVDKVNATNKDELTYTVKVVNNSTATMTGLKLSDVITDGNGANIPYGSTFSISNVTFNNGGITGNTAVNFTNGVARNWTTNTLDATMTLQPNSTASFTIKGKLKGVPVGGMIVNKAVITPPTISGINDDPTNNTSEVSTAVEGVPTNYTFAIDDFIETDPNTSISGNVMDNDYDLEGDAQAVTSTGTQTTKEGGTIVFNADGTYTYTPPKDFSGIDHVDYTVCDNAAIAQACATATLTIGVGICTEEVSGKEFSWSQSGGIGTRTQTITQPASNYGFAFDIYELDNSFNMEVNGTKIAVNELQFQKTNTPGINVRFADGYNYGADDICKLRGDKLNPIVRVVISPTGSVSLYGSKVSGGKLYPLVLTSNKEGVNRFNKIQWNSDAENTIIVTQLITGTTIMRGYGYGKFVTTCVNYWIGGTPDKVNEWKEPNNWTYNIVPAEGQDVIFATEKNNPTNSNKPKSGPAREDLHLDNLDQNNTGGRVIGNLINSSDKDLVVTLGNQLTINGTVTDENADKGTIVVKADATNQTPNGTLLFANVTGNENVAATVEFYNKAYECADCGYYRKSWQYFGIPVKNGAFPVADVDGAETINQWVEPFSGNKWQPAPYTPDATLMAFRGYEMTNDTKTLPKDVYSFVGTLNVGNAAVELTKTATVNYSGVNLIGNSYTAAIPITPDVLTFSQDIADKSVYLFNTGTRDQWRKLNGSTADGLLGGQYLAVPINLAGAEELPKMIPSTHAFMLRADKPTTLTIDYGKLVKNQTIKDAAGNDIATRSVETTDKVKKLPAILMDVIGQGTADRVWIFSKANTTFGFDSGWDGRKMADEGLSQLYVAATDNSKLQVATVPSFDKVELGFEPVAEGEYTLEFAPSDELNNAKIYLNDLLTGKKQQIVNGGTYLFTATKGEAVNRFSLSYTAGSSVFSGDEALIHITTGDGVIKITNESANACSISISDDKGHTISRGEVSSNSEQIFSGIADGTYIVRLQNANVNDMRSITLGN